MIATVRPTAARTSGEAVPRAQASRATRRQPGGCPGGEETPLPASLVPRASGQSRDQVIEDAVRRSLAGRALATLFERVRQRSDLSEEQATSLVASEKADMRAEERGAKNDLARDPSRR